MRTVLRVGDHLQGEGRISCIKQVSQWNNLNVNFRIEIYIFLTSK